MSHCVIVLGGHRCGTSLVAGVLHHLGLPAGLDESPEHLLQGARGNPGGHYEDRIALRLHQRMLGNDRWRDPQPERFDLSAEVREEYRRHLMRRAEAAPRWCLKDPRLCFLLPMLATTLDELAIPFSVVTAVRRSADAISSLRERNPMPDVKAASLVQRYEGARRAGVAWLKERYTPVLAVHYEKLIAAPVAQVARIAAFCKVPATAAATSLVQPSRHNPSESPDPGDIIPR
jgi:hypothetical protein